ncbi:MAG: FAD-binding protein [Planctomycetota bacterium]|nr:MAG: FAD-binding protein [Planctomycetota bacterium]REJ96562.1 MAG: FAD-binding protein [Planctomycetota bacterium]REK21754.1 MAG: FAD-binding protein [Planctomycetota bacterium]REK43160.1 MAG: FAD-binding protein [Planctomycetota bacterium]
MESPQDIPAVQELVRAQSRIRVRGGGSKSALAAEANVSLAGLSGMVQYDASEFTFTALAGTPVREVAEQLARHGQYLPFEPPLADDGATLGGTVAAGLSGSARYRYGGVRDFLLGVRLVDGRGELVRGGGNVVKNVAGFDLPKLMVGSLGRFGVVVELSFKVFPAPERTSTILAEFGHLDTAMAAVDRMATSPFDLMCLDVEPPNRLWIRIGGIGDALHARLARLTSLLEMSDARIGMFADDAEIWQDVSQFRWARENANLVKIPLVPSEVPRLEARIARWNGEVTRRYGVGGTVAYLAWSEPTVREGLESTLAAAHRSSLALWGDWPDPRLGPSTDNAMSDRLAAALDPQGKFAIAAAVAAPPGS